MLPVHVAMSLLVLRCLGWHESLHVHVFSHAMVLQTRSAPLQHIYGAEFESPEVYSFSQSRSRLNFNGEPIMPLTSGTQGDLVVSTRSAGPCRSPEGMAFRPKGRDATERLHAHSRSLPDTPSSSSSLNHPLLVGIVIGVVGTLSVFGLAYIFRRFYGRNKVKSVRPIPIPLRPSAPREFRHLEHFTTSQQDFPSPTNTTASSLRVAHRRPDGSWAFTETLYDRERDPGPDPTMPISPTTTFLTSPVSDSSGTVFSYDDASSTKSGPPPYVHPALVPPLPRHEGEKLKGRPSRR